MDVSGIEAAQQPTVDTTERPTQGRRRPALGRLGRVATAVLALAAAAVLLYALAQAALDAELAGAAWDVVDLGR